MSTEKSFEKSFDEQPGADERSIRSLGEFFVFLAEHWRVLLVLFGDFKKTSNKIVSSGGGLSINFIGGVR